MQYLKILLVVQIVSVDHDSEVRRGIRIRTLAVCVRVYVQEILSLCRIADPCRIEVKNIQLEYLPVADYEFLRDHRWF